MLYARPLPESAAALAGHPERVRDLISEVTDLPHRAVVLARALVRYVDWQEWCCPPKPDNTDPYLSPSAARLAQAVRCSTRTVRRAYLDLERCGLLERQPRAWLPNFFKLNLERLIELARESRGEAAETMRQKWARWTPPPRPQRAPATPTVEAPPTDVDLVEEAAELLTRLPPWWAAQIGAALAVADGLLEGQSRPPWSADGVDEAHRAPFARLMYALYALLHPEEKPERIRRRAGAYRRKVAAAWRGAGYCAPELMLIDLSLVIAARGYDWHRALRGDRWAVVRDQVWLELRERTEERDLWERLPDAPPPLPPAPEPEEAPQAPAVGPEELEALRAQAVVMEALHGALVASPALPSVGQLAAIAPERREVRRVRLARAELEQEIERWYQLAEAEPPDVEQLAACVARAEAVAAELRLKPPPD